MSGRLQKRSVTLAQHRTSIALEPPFWNALTALAASRGQPLAHLIAQADASRHDDESLASLLRLLALAAARDGEIPHPVTRADPARAARRNGARARRA